MISLKNILQINAISSGATGALLLLFPGPVARLFAVAPTAPFLAVGLFLLVFASGVLHESVQQPIRARRVGVIILLDVVWVVASFIAVGLLFSTFSVAGNLLMVAVAVWVAAMAFLQAKGLRQLAG